MLAPQFILPLATKIVVDLFAGGGGASTGIEQAIGRHVDVAINHDPKALAMHQANHPQTLHLRTNVWDVEPRSIVARFGGRGVGALWASPDCRHFSPAKGGAPVSDRVRSLAWVVIKWAAQVEPDAIFLENIPEFRNWGPVVAGRPCAARRGKTFRRFVLQLQRTGPGYDVEFRELVAADYDTPTTRKRLFMVAKKRGTGPIVWPEPTNGPGLRPYRTAAECIDWSLPCPSIFERARPLAPATMRRIAHGVWRYVVTAQKPFIVGLAHGEHRDRAGRRVHAVDEEPLRTIHAGGWHHAEVRALLLAYYGTEQDAQLTNPLPTATTRDRFAIVTVAGQDYVIADIGMRMLQPRELFRAQGFPDSYIIEWGIEPETGRRITLTKSDQVRMCGNSVCPKLARAIVAANYSDYELQEAA